MPPIKKKTHEENLLLHNILQALRFSGTSITQAGSDLDGHFPYYEYEPKTSVLHFGTLADYIHNPHKYIPKPGDIVRLKDKITKSEEVAITRVQWEQLSIAVDVLKVNGDVIVTFDPIPGQEFKSKNIRFTEQGYYKLNTRYYLKEHQKEAQEKTLHKSVVNTNRWMIALTAAITIGTLWPIGVSVKEAFDKSETNSKQVKSEISTHDKKSQSAAP